MADAGFWPPKSPEIPAKIAEGARKALRMIVLKKAPHLEVPGGSVAALAKALAEDPQGTLFAMGLVPDGMLAKVYLNDLGKAKEGQRFFIRGGSVGTAFFYKPGVLLTTRSAFNGVVLPKAFYEAETVEQARRALLTWEGRMVLVDAEGKIRFDTQAPEQKIEAVLFSGHPVEVKNLAAGYQAIEKSALGQMMDVVAFRLKGIDTRDLELEVSAEVPKSGEPVYAAGYPLRTLKREDHAAPNADGNSLRVSRGKILEKTPEDYEKFLRTLMADDGVRSNYENALLFSDTDIVDGLSGGPWFDPYGKVVSLVSTVRHDPKLHNSRKYSVTASYGPKLKLIIPLINLD